MTPIPNMKREEIAALRACFNKNLYTADNIKHWEECEVKLNAPPYKATIRTFDGNGEAHEIPAQGPGKILRYASYHQAVHKAEAQSASDKGFEYMLVRVTDADPATPPKECCDTEGRKEKYAEYTKQWKATAWFGNFIKKVEEKAKSMVEVKSIACFGLGHLEANPNFAPTHMIANYLQHVVVLEIRTLLAVEHKVPPEDIPIYAQDPKYCTNCKDILEKELGFTVMESNSGFLKVDGNTFVITSAPSVPVRQIVGDLTKDVGGPAGILCQPIDGDGVETANKIVDMPSPSINEFANKAYLTNMAMTFTAERADSSDEESDLQNSVFYSDEYAQVYGSILPDFAIYLKKG
jgi:hypothetical protein